MDMKIKIFSMFEALWIDARIPLTNLNFGQLEHLWEGVDAVGVGGQHVQPPAAEDGGGNGSQSVAAQVQLLQQLQPSQFTAEGGENSETQTQILTCMIIDLLKL